MGLEHKVCEITSHTQLILGQQYRIVKPFDTEVLTLVDIEDNGTLIFRQDILEGGKEYHGYVSYPKDEVIDHFKEQGWFMVAE